VKRRHPVHTSVHLLFQRLWTDEKNKTDYAALVEDDFDAIPRILFKLNHKKVGFSFCRQTDSLNFI
jgi:hypothetical protein